MFTERINAVMSGLRISVSDLSHYLGCDRSNVSRIVKGKRVPKPYGKAAWKLVSAVYHIAEHSGRTSFLRMITRESAAMTAEEIMQVLMSWLFEEESAGRASAGEGNAVVPFQSFGQRLDTVMRISQTSNIQLGRYLNTDPSYISRFRNGIRYPKSNPKIKNKMCYFLLERMIENHQLDELAVVLRVPAAFLSDKEEGYTILYRWLYGAEQNDLPEVEKLIEQIGGLAPEQRLSDRDAAEKPEPASADDRTVYIGKEGLRSSVKRFLNAVIGARAGEIFLYSDQSMNWMTDDETFCAEWRRLMQACIENGTVIYIIHNIERNTGEISRGVKHWLPLYPSGKIRSYYCIREQDARFSTTLFLCPSVACVSGSSFMGTEDHTGIYRYDTGMQLLTSYGRMFGALLADSLPLLKVYEREQVLRSDIGFDSDNTILTGRLSLATMPEQVLFSVMSRIGLDDKKMQEITGFWRHQQELYRRCLKNYIIHECIALMPFARIKIDLPFAEAYYTKEEYIAHLRNLASLSERYENYRLCLLPEPAFDRVRIRVSHDHVLVTRLTTPVYSFVFENPRLCAAFRSYAEGVRSAYNIDKQTVRSRIESYIADDIL